MTTVLVAGVAAGCATNQAGATVAPAASAPASVAAATTAPTAAAKAAAAATVDAKAVGSIGTVLVATSNGMTVYQFAKDVKDSGTSACTDACITKWPPLTVPAGGSPVAGTGITGKLGTITRADSGALQVTYNGLPLYFFSGDSKPGDANGVYTNWMAVTP